LPFACQNLDGNWRITRASFGTDAHPAIIPAATHVMADRIFIIGSTSTAESSRQISLDRCISHTDLM
jgi:hypothetical protein